MSESKSRSRTKAGMAAVFLLLTGGFLGVMADRLWLLRPEPSVPPLTTEAMAASLGLAPGDEARVQSLLDSLHIEVTTAAMQGPESLRTTTRNAHQRLEAALPPEARLEFRAWMQEHHSRMMERMGGGPMGRRGPPHP